MTFSFQAPTKEIVIVTGKFVDILSVGVTSLIQLLYIYKGPGKAYPIKIVEAFNAANLIRCQKVPAPPAGTTNTYIRATRYKTAPQIEVAAS